MTVTLSSPASSQTIDLSGAKSVGDLKAIIENAFAPGAITVAINAMKNGITLTPAAGTVAIADIPGGNTARDLNLITTAVAQADSGDLDPRLTLTTKLADLNGGTGIGTTAGNGLHIVNGNTTKAVDISAAVTIEDLLNLLRSPDLQLSAELNASGNGLAISTRLSGADFSIGENNGNNATLLGIRTLVGGTRLSDLKFGAGVPVNAGLPLTITRRDSSTVNVDLTGSVTMQDVLDKINAVDPGNLVASLRAVGNGISLLDNSGTGPLSIDTGEMAVALGLGGTETGNDPTVPLLGTDPNPQEVHGTLNVLTRLKRALETNDNRELVRVNALVDRELTRITKVRGEAGGRLKVLEDVSNRLQDENIQAQEALSRDFDADLAELLTELLTRQTAYEATLRAASQTMQLSLFNFL
jgi:flagellar hook-associated protein 3 FlgL